MHRLRMVGSTWDHTTSKSEMARYKGTTQQLCVTTQNDTLRTVRDEMVLSARERRCCSICSSAR
jgi:hypothetical protein